MIFSENYNIHESFRLIKTTPTDYSHNGTQHEEMDVSEIEYKDKTIVVLCGNNTKSPLKASTYARHCINWIRHSPIKPHTTVYSLYYPKQQPLYNTLRPNPAFDYDKLAEALFYKILTKNDGKLANIDEITEKLGNITFFGHSVGGYVMNELMNGLGKIMQEQQYSNRDINKAFSSIVFVGYSPYALIQAPINNVIVAPIYDSVGSTKLVYDKMKRNRFTQSSNQDINILHNAILKSTPKDRFLDTYQSLVNNEDVLYFVNKHSLVATPNLLYFDGIKEDHNLAGVINYPADHPYKTQAGKLTTLLMKDVFSYSLMADRKDFSLSYLYDLANDRYNYKIESKPEKSDTTTTTEQLSEKESEYEKTN